MKDPVWRLVLCYIFGAALIILIALLSSCTSSKSVFKQTTDSTYLKELADSVRVLRSENSRLTAEISEMQYASVRFDTVYVPGDTVINTVTITKEGEVKASGRVSSAYVSKSVLTKIVNEQNRVIDSLKELKEKVNVVTRTEYKDKVKKVSFIPWWVFLLCLPFLGLYVYEKIKKDGN